MLDRFYRRFGKEGQVFELPVCFPVHQSHSEFGCSLKENNLFPVRVHSFSGGSKNNFDRVDSLEILPNAD